MSFLELLAPVTSSEVHMFLFDSACVRGGPSINVPLTANDVALLRIDNIGAPAPTSGLVTAAASDGAGFTLLPLEGPIAARTLWANSNGNFVRVIDPIALAGSTEFFDIDNIGGWSPMRSAAAFFAPLEASGLHTTIYFVCPNTNIQRSVLQAGATNGGAFSPGNGFPVIFPTLQVAGSTTPLRVRVYNDDESLLRDVTSSCNCLTIRPVTQLDLVYASAVDAPNGTYTEVEGAVTNAVPATCSTTVVEQLVTVGVPNANNACSCAAPALGTLGTTGAPGTCTAQFQQLTPLIPALGPFSFVAYRAITVPGFDVFGRVMGASRCEIQGGFCPFDR
jgi:hypothetical protein